MSYTYKTLVRDKLVDNATVKGLFSAGATGSCRINMEDLIVSAGYPQVLIGWVGGETISNMDTDEGRLYLTIEARGTGSTHAHRELGLLRSAILNVIDDTALQSNTGVCYLMRKFSEFEGYDDKEKVWWMRLGFSTTYRQNFSLA